MARHTDKGFFHRNADRIVLGGNVAYSATFILACVYFHQMSFRGDAAGKGMAAGLTFLAGAAFFFGLTIALLILNKLSLKGITIRWLRYLTAAPLVLPLGYFGYLQLESMSFQAEIKKHNAVQGKRFDAWLKRFEKDFTHGLAATEFLVIDKKSHVLIKVRARKQYFQLQHYAIGKIVDGKILELHVDRGDSVEKWRKKKWPRYLHNYYNAAGKSLFEAYEVRWVKKSPSALEYDEKKYEFKTHGS